jgi:hypothetical protein
LNARRGTRILGNIGVDRAIYPTAFRSANPLNESTPDQDHVLAGVSFRVDSPQDRDPVAEPLDFARRKGDHFRAVGDTRAEMDEVGRLPQGGDQVFERGTKSHEKRESPAVQVVAPNANELFLCRNRNASLRSDPLDYRKSVARGPPPFRFAAVESGANQIVNQLVHGSVVLFAGGHQGFS